jgi:ATP-dependent protease ClpP protease subunit
MKGFRLEQTNKSLELDLYGAVGDAWEGISASKVVALLRNSKDAEEILVRINSYGGAASDGIAIMDVLKDHAAKVHVKIDGMAASAASLIAMAGDTIEMGEGAFLMVHKPWGIAMGTDDEMLKVAEVLEKMETEIVNIYARRSGKSVDEVRGWVENETWFTGTEAVEAGLADKAVEDPESIEKAARAYAEYGHQIFNFAHLPESLKVQVEALGKAGGEEPPPEKEEVSAMSDIKTITSAELAEARPDLVEAIKSEALKDAKAEAEAAVKAERDRAAGIATKAAELKCDANVAELIANGVSLQDAREQMLNAKEKQLHEGAQAEDVGHDEGESESNPFLPK